MLSSREGNFCPQMLPQMFGAVAPAWPRLCGCCAVVADDGIGVSLTIAVPWSDVYHPSRNPCPMCWCECQQILLPSCPHMVRVRHCWPLGSNIVIRGEREGDWEMRLYKSGSKMKYNGLVKQLTKSLSVVSPPINNCLQNVNFHFKKRICAGDLARH